MSVSLTNIVDVLLDADGTPAQGQVTVHWGQFMVNGTAVSQGQRTYEVVDGVINLSLYPTVNAQPSGSYYTATFELDNGSVFDEYWLVASQPTMKLNQIRSMFPPAPGLFINSLQITGGGAANGQFLGWNGTQWVPMYVTTLNVSPNNMVFQVTSLAGADVSLTGGDGGGGAGPTSVTLGSQLTINVPDAGPNSRGVVNTGAQTFAGAKTFASPAVFNSAITLSSFVPVNPQWGQVWFDSQNVFHLQGSLQLHGDGENLTMLGITQLVAKYLDLSQGTLSEAVRNPANVTFPGKESILLAGATVAHGIGVDVHDWLWLGSGNAYASLRPDAAWVTNWIDLSPYQHPIHAGTEASPNQASVVLYSDATQWIGMGVDNAMRIWFRIGPNGAGQYYYLAPDGGSLGVYTWVNHALVAQRAGINLIPGQFVTMGAVDNPANNTVDVTINALGNLVDPTTARGDLIVRGQILPQRFPAVYDNQYRVLTCDPTGLHGLSWTIGVPTSRRIIAGAGLWGGGDLSGDVDIWANVLSVFGRTGNVVLTGADIINAGGVMDPTLIKGDLIVRSPWLTVNRGLTRLGAGASDGVVDGSILVTDSTLDLGLKWVPGSQLGAQTPWIQDVDGDGYTLYNVGLITGVGAITAVGQIGIGTAMPAHALDVVGDGAFTGNLLVGGDLVVDGGTTLGGDLAVDGNFSVAGTSTLTGDVTLGADLDVSGNSTLGGNLDIAGNGAVAGDFAVGGDSTLSGAFSVTGDSTLTGLLDVTGDSTFTGDVAVTGAFAVTGDMTVTGDLALTGDTALNGALEVTGDSQLLGSLDIGANLDVGGYLDVVGDATIQGDFTVAGAFVTGTTVVHGALDVTGDSDLGGDLAVGGDSTFAGDVDITGTLTAPSIISGSTSPIQLSPEIEVAAISSGSTTPVVFDPPLEAGYIDLNPDIQTWGNVQAALEAIDNSIQTLSRGMSYVGSYDAANDIATFVPSLSALDGPLPPADSTGLEQGDFLIATSASATIDMGDQLISGGPTGGANWDILAVGHVAMTASMVAVTAATGIPVGWTTVQAALADIAGGAAQTPWLSNINADGYALVSGSTTNALVFGTGTTAAMTERMRINATGVGIGTNAPAALLHVNGNQIVNNTIYTTAGVNLTLGSGSTTARVTLTNVGDVGVGNTMASPPFSGTGPIFMVGSTTAATYGCLVTCSNTTTTTAITGAIMFANYAIAAAPRHVAQIACYLDGAINSGAIVFLTTSAGTQAERMRITSAGDVGIGTNAATFMASATGIPKLIVGTSVAGGNYGYIATCVNTSAANAAVGGFGFANYGITATEKRVAQISCSTGAAINSGNIQFFTWNAGSLGERMRITETGNVGIGTNAPTTLLHLNTPGTNAAAAFATLAILARMPGDPNFQLRTFNGDNNNLVGNEAARFGLYYASTSEWNSGIRWLRGGGRPDGVMCFDTYGIERMRIASNGNVGLGNEAPAPFSTAGNYPQLIVGPTVVTGFHGFLVTCGNTTSTTAPVGAYAFANFAITAAEKRIAEIHAATDGAINSGCLRFYTWNAGTSVQRMRITALGHVAIGSDGAPPFGGAYNILMVGSQTAGGAKGVIATCNNITTASTEVGFLGFTNYAVAGANKAIAIISGITGAQSNSGRLLFYTYNQGTEAERMRILETGEVGINTTTPGAVGAKFEVNGNIICGPPSSNGHGWIRIRAGNAVNNEAYVSFIKQAPAASAQEWQIGLVDATGNYVLWGSNATVPSTIHWTATPGGNFGIGVASPTYRLQLGWDSAAKPGTNTWTIASDLRVKRNVEPFDGGIETIRQLQPIVAEYNGMANMPDGMRVVSLDPKKLREVVPHAVSSVRGKLRDSDAEETDILGVNTHEVFYHMLRAIQQLDRELRQLKGEH